MRLPLLLLIGCFACGGSEPPFVRMMSVMPTTTDLQVVLDIRGEVDVFDGELSTVQLDIAAPNGRITLQRTHAIGFLGPVRREDGASPFSRSRTGRSSISPVIGRARSSSGCECRPRIRSSNPSRGAPRSH